MAKMKNPGFLSEEERQYLRSSEMGWDSWKHVSNPGRAKARILEFQEGLHRAIECFVEDVRWMHFTPRRYVPEEILRKLSEEEIGSELTRSVSAKRIGFLRFCFLDNPLFYLLIVTLEALTRKTLDQKQAILETMGLCLVLAAKAQERIEEQPKLRRAVASQREVVEFFGTLVPGVREELSVGKDDADWLEEHPKEKEALLVVLTNTTSGSGDGEELRKKKRWVHRDKISDTLNLPKRGTTRLLTILGNKGLVEREGQKYSITSKGESAAMYLFITSRDRTPFL